MADPVLSLAGEDPDSPDAALLIRELSKELGDRYEDDGAGAFDAADAKVPRSCFVVARLDGRPVGCGALRPFSPQEPHAAEVKRMYVRPEARGRHIAKEILAHLEKAARGFGYAVVRLETGLRQPEAINLYVKAGYTRIPRYGRYANQPLSACFEKKLS